MKRHLSDICIEVFGSDFFLYPSLLCQRHFRHLSSPHSEFASSHFHFRKYLSFTLDFITGVSKTRPAGRMSPTNNVSFLIQKVLNSSTKINFLFVCFNSKCGPQSYLSLNLRNIFSRKCGPQVL